jgi:hypothetical protein
MRFFTAVLVACCLSIAVAPAQASHRRTHYCSASGDVCQSTQKRDGVRKLEIGLSAKHFSRYKLCVIAPDDSRSCEKRKIHCQPSGTCGDKVRWDTHFPDMGPGAYTVVWKFTSGKVIGKKLGFHE